MSKGNVQSLNISKDESKGEMAQSSLHVEYFDKRIASECLDPA